MSTLFSRTEKAAETLRESPWGVIEAIAADATEQGWPITGIETRSEAKKALIAAGLVADTVKDRAISNYCLVAKFVEGAAERQRQVYRRYAWSGVLQFAATGWSHADTYDALKGQTRKTYSEIVRLTRGSPVPVPGTRTLDEMAHDVLAKAAAFFREAAAFMESYEGAAEHVDPSGHAALTYQMCRAQMERRFDAELRSILEDQTTT